MKRELANLPWKSQLLTLNVLGLWIPSVLLLHGITAEPCMWAVVTVNATRVLIYIVKFWYKAKELKIMEEMWWCCWDAAGMLLDQELFGEWLCCSGKGLRYRTMKEVGCEDQQISVCSVGCPQFLSRTDWATWIYPVWRVKYRRGVQYFLELLQFLC